MKKFVMAAFAAFFVSGSPVAAAPVQNEILFLMDSSGSLFDPDYSRWQSEIDWVLNFVDQTHRDDGSNAYGIINFSGGRSIHTVQNVKELGNLNLVYGLTPGMTDPLFTPPDTVPGEQDKASLDAFIGAMGPDDFRSGFTWTDEALQLAYETFLLSGNGDTNKFIFLLTEGDITPGHEPAIASGGITTYESPTLQTLRASDISLSVVAIDPTQAQLDNYIVPLVSDPSLLFQVDGFDDFTNFLPSNAMAMPAPGAIAFLALGAVVLAGRRRKTRRLQRNKTVI